MEEPDFQAALEEVQAEVRAGHEEADRLVGEYLWLAESVARRTATAGDYDQRLSDALLGLLRSARDFVWTPGSNFVAFAAQRMRWGIVDGARRTSGDARTSLPFESDVLSLSEPVPGLDVSYEDLVSEPSFEDDTLTRLEVEELLRDLSKRELDVARAVAVGFGGEAELARRYGVTDGAVSLWKRALMRRLRQRALKEAC